MRYLTIIFCGVFVLFSLQQVQAKIIHVPADSSTIQAGINGAADGDTVLVAEGHYYERINFYGKGILVTSEFLYDGDPLHIQNTIIDGDSSGTVVSFSNDENSTSIIQGFTIQNGLADRGGGMACSQASPTIAHCTIIHNIAEGGGGIYCYQSSPTVDSCTIISNTTRWFYLRGGKHNIIDNTTNSAPPGAGCGGGILCMNFSEATITNCTITDNFAFYSYVGGSGGGISCLSSSPRITNCVIEYNWQGVGLNLGGGISCWAGSSPIITNCTIRYNSAGYGGGVACDSSSPEISYCAIIHNTAQGGGGISCWRSSLLSILNCTVTHNTATHGGGISCHDCDFLSDITNSILWDDSPDEVYTYSGLPPVFFVTYSDIEGGWPGEGNINCDPLFCYPDTDNYYLAENSCCAGMGEGGVDIGAFGVGCEAIYICGDANGDLTVDIADVVYLINYLFIDGPPPDPLGAGDANCDGTIDSADVVYLINYLFIGGPPPCCP
jgi:predicted outer membrane repeat protein